MPPITLREKLLSGEASAAVWGTGHVGATTAAYFAREGVRVIAYDKSPAVIASLAEGITSIPSTVDHLGFSMKPLIDRGLILATNDRDRILRDPGVKVHFIAVPTERAGKPWSGALRDVINHLARKEPVDGPDLIVVESTLAPGYSQRFVVDNLESQGRRVGSDYMYVVAPRRDWFVDRKRNLQTLPRVVGAADERSLNLAQEVLGIVCRHLVPVSSYAIAELVKPLENAFRAINIALVDEIARAFPTLDVREAIEAAATKWNFLAHFPAAGIGGHCVPLAPEYLLAGSDESSLGLPLLDSFSDSVSTHTRFVADTLHAGANDGHILLLGLAYKADLKVYTNSPTICIAQRLQQLGVNFSIHDPLYTSSEIKSITGASPAKFPEDLKSSATVAILVDHRKYRDFSEDDVKRFLRERCSILDVEGSWEGLEPTLKKEGITYRLLGKAGWTNLDASI